MRRTLFAGLSIGLIMLSSGAAAVSIGEMAGKCGDDSKAYCKGVGYGDAMLECLDAHYKKLTPDCKLIVDRLKDGEGVSLF